MTTVERIIKGKGHAAALAAHLVRQSVWFTIDPYPDNEWKFTVKPEAERYLPTEESS